VVLAPAALNGQRGVDVLALDRGPGIADVERALRDGYSTAGTAGTGLGAVVRLSDLFDVYTGRAGTVLLARVWAGRAAAVGATDRLAVGAICIPRPGEEVCGDGWALGLTQGHATVLLVDGLGHGTGAAEAATAAVASFRAHAATSTPADLLTRMHAALRPTRGAAALVLALDARQRLAIVAGVGNIAGTILSAAGNHSVASHHGIVGHEAARIREFRYPWPARSLVVVHTDGIGSRWSLDAYPGLSERHPLLIAGVLYRDFRRPRDDATVVVIREAA